MVYNVIGLMSGSSLDGLDICFTQLEENRGKWSAQITHAACIPYNDYWTEQLSKAAKLSVPDFLRLHTAYGHYIGQSVQSFIAQNELQHKVHFVGSHGHTVWHEPQASTTFQLGDGAAIAAVLNLPVISDLRALDIALGGQGAPIVPIGDKLLFGDYDILLNIGGICNASIKDAEGNYIAFDISIANQALNYLAQKVGKAYDEAGALAAQGVLLIDELSDLSNFPYYQHPAPKSLSNELAFSMVESFLNQEQYRIEDRLHTMVQFIAQQITTTINAQFSDTQNRKLLLTGGGALNDYLVSVLKAGLAAHQIELILPDAQTIAYKEALVMSLMAALRWREETNVLSSATGAQRNSISGAFWIGT